MNLIVTNIQELVDTSDVIHLVIISPTIETKAVYKGIC